MVEPGMVERVQVALLGWYAQHGRDLPWRHTRDPYAVLVAEVMLQQTQVERVIPKWHAWLARFPRFADLAAAGRAEAIRAWQGLGYNVRAVRLHGIAQQVVQLHGGELPRTLDGLLRLKGIGRYTAGAVACFAFDQPVAMIDTNVRRVLGRVFLGGESVDIDETTLRRVAEAVVPAEAAYAWSQALMDLGATLCRARRPACLLCPLREVCVAVGSTRGRRRARVEPTLPPGVSGGWVEAGQLREARSAYTARERAAAEARARRGRVVDALRGLQPGATLELTELAQRLQPPEPESRLARLVDKLLADGLLALERDPGDGRVRLRLAD